jgi:hypothetical protein
MAGKIKRLVDQIVEKKGKGNEVLISLTKAKLIMKGINPDKYGPASPDDPVVLGKLVALANELGVAAMT